MDEIIKIYCDGSCIGNPGPWGYAAILLFGDNSKTLEWNKNNTTNNQMELQSVISALSSLKTDKYIIQIFMDSKYVCDWITKYIDNWLVNWWKTANKTPIKNQEMWMELYDLTKWKKIEWNWVKWHADDHMNNLVDKIARKQAMMLK